MDYYYQDLCAQAPQQGAAAEIHVNLYLLRAPSDCERDIAYVCFAHTDGERLHLWEELRRVNGMHVR